MKFQIQGEREETALTQGKRHKYMEDSRQVTDIKWRKEVTILIDVPKYSVDFIEGV